MTKKRNEVHKRTDIAARKKDLSLRDLIRIGIQEGEFKKPGTEEMYSVTWVEHQLRYLGNRDVSKKLVILAKSI